MLTWKLWRALNRPDRLHPLFARAAALYRPKKTGLSGCLGEALELLALFAWPLGMILVGTPLGSTWYGAQFALQTAGAVQRERERGTLDLLNVTPGGALDTGWQTMTACFQQRQETFQFFSLMYWVFALPLCGLCSVILALSASTSPTQQGDVLLGVALAVMVVGVMYVDRVQSMLLAGLIGLLAAQRVQDAAGAQGAALGGFLLAQAGGYFVALMALWGVMLLPVSGTGMLAVGGILIAYAALREAFIGFIWRRLCDAAGADDGELWTMLKIDYS